MFTQSIYQKHLEITLGFKLTFENPLKIVATRINKTIGLLRKLQNLLPRAALTTIYKAFVRPHRDYGDILNYQAFNLSFHQKLESIYEVPLEKRFTKSYAYNHINHDSGIEN